MAVTSIRRHVALPEIPTENLSNEAILLSSMKENVELLTGTRGESDLASMAIVRGDMTVSQVGNQLMGTVSADGSGFTISAVEVASLASHRALRDDVQRLANDLARTRAALDLLIQNMRG
jgi:hydroxymethylpyrimidine/phosphomethylpyrimidine kinase